MQMRQFEIKSEKARREAEQIRTVIVDLDCTVQLLDCEIAAEELRARVFKPTNVAYPTLAKSMAARRDNLNGTIAALEKQLAVIRAALAQGDDDSGLTKTRQLEPGVGSSAMLRPA